MSAESTLAPVGPTDVIRPILRGVFHRVAVVVAIPAFAVLIVMAPTAGARAASAIYALGILAMLGVSAVYHSGRLSERTTQIFKRIDHSTILLAVTGSYTAVAVGALEGRSRVTLLVFVWTAAVVGMIIRMRWLHGPRAVSATVYLVVGWSALIEIAALVRSLDAVDTVLLVVGGGLYTIGAVIYSAKWPNPFPRVLGFHEVFHALVVGAVVVHYVLVARLVIPT
jgi:hemolysin III